MTDIAAQKAGVSRQKSATSAAPRKQRTPGMGFIWNTRLLGVFFIVVLLLLWEFVARSNASLGTTFPRMSAILVTWGQLIVSGELFSQLVPSLLRMFGGYFIGVLLGVILGLLMGSIRFFYNLLEPVTELLRPIPSPAYLPIVILFLGIDDEMKIFMIAFASLFPVLLNTYSGVRGVDPIQIQTCLLYTSPSPRD